jgi:hypothetical protein
MLTRADASGSSAEEEVGDRHASPKVRSGSIISGFPWHHRDSAHSSVIGVPSPRGFHSLAPGERGARVAVVGGSRAWQISVMFSSVQGHSSASTDLTLIKLVCTSAVDSAESFREVVG